MKMGKSFNKSILFVLGIILVVSAFSGCTDVDGPDSLFTDAGASELVGKDIREVHKQLETAGYDIEVTTFPKSQKINGVFVYNEKGDELVIKDNDGKLTNDGILAIESAVLNPNKTPAADNPAPTDDAQNLIGIEKFAKYGKNAETMWYIDQLFNNPEFEAKGTPINNYIIDDPLANEEYSHIEKGLDPQKSEEFAKKFGGIEAYYYEYDANDNPTEIYIITSEMVARIRDTNNDGNIDLVRK